MSETLRAPVLNENTQEYSNHGSSLEFYLVDHFFPFFFYPPEPTPSTPSPGSSFSYRDEEETRMGDRGRVTLFEALNLSVVLASLKRNN